MTFLFLPGIIAILLMGHYMAAIIIALLYYPICFIWGVRAVINGDSAQTGPVIPRQSGPHFPQ